MTTQVVNGESRRNFDQQVNRKKGRLGGAEACMSFEYKSTKDPQEIAWISFCEV